MYAAYRVVCQGIPPAPPTAAPSWPASDSIILNRTAPSVSLNSPAGLILNPDTGATQTQFINSASAQWVTYSASSPAGEAVTVLVDSCHDSTCTELTPNPVETPPYLWEWPDGASAGTDTYIQLTATDQAGNPASTPAPNPTTVFQLFDPGASLESVTCSPSVCATLADQLPRDIPGDPPSGPDPNGHLFSGYSDPSMCRDSLITASNPYGTNLWMLYSWPMFNMSTLTGYGTVYSGAVETHLANSSTAGGPNGGANWTAWCSGADCSAETPRTPIWPSVSFGSGNGQYFSSHEVTNF